MFPFTAVVGAILLSPSITSGAQISPAWIMWSASASCFIAAGRSRPCVSEIMPIRIQMRQSGFGELESEVVLWRRRVRRVLIPGIVRVTQEVSLLLQLEACRFDLLPEKRFFYAMQGARFGDAGPRPA